MNLNRSQKIGPCIFKLKNNRRPALRANIAIQSREHLNDANLRRRKSRQRKEQQGQDEWPDRTSPRHGFLAEGEFCCFKYWTTISNSLSDNFAGGIVPSGFTERGS